MTWLGDKWRLFKNRRAYKKNRRDAPKSIDAALEKLEEMIPKMDDGIRWMTVSEDKATSTIHFGFGMWLRNNWGLWDKKSSLHKEFVKRYEIWHADDMSSILLTSVHRKMKSLEPNIEEQIEHYKDHWRQHGIEGVPEHHFED